MLNLSRIIIREIRLRLREPFRISSGVVDERRIMLLELHDADGVVEWAECVAGEFPNYSSETVETAWHAIRAWLAPRMLGKRIASPDALHEILERHVCGHNMAKAALEMGGWALAARKQGVPLSRLLGGTRQRIVTGISIGIQRDPEALVARAQRAVAEGYRKVKVKIQPGADLAFVRQALDGDAASTLAPLVAKRAQYKKLVRQMEKGDPARETYRRRYSAHKWLLVTCFGYLGYKNARFGRIEAHEAVTARGREVLLQAKEIVEDRGFRVLHLYVDALWIHKPGAEAPPDYDSLLEEIEAAVEELPPPQVADRLGFLLAVHPVDQVAEQEALGGEGDVGLELAHPVAVGPLDGQEVRLRPGDRVEESGHER